MAETVVAGVEVYYTEWLQNISEGGIRCGRSASTNNMILPKYCPIGSEPIAEVCAMAYVKHDLAIFVDDLIGIGKPAPERTVAAIRQFAAEHAANPYSVSSYAHYLANKLQKLA